jgi:hypothetical protein
MVFHPAPPTVSYGPAIRRRYRQRWKERRKRARDRYAEMSDEQREAISPYRHRPKGAFRAHHRWGGTPTPH